MKPRNLEKKLTIYPQGTREHFQDDPGNKIPLGNNLLHSHCPGEAVEPNLFCTRDRTVNAIERGQIS